jgi:hypothetical protein
MTQEDMAEFVATTFRDSMIDGFDAVMSGAKSLKDGLKDMIAGFLQALGKMFFTQFLAYLLFAPRKAMGALAASIAAYAGAAVVRSLAKGGEFVTQGPELMMVGDNPSGRERVSVTPAESPAYNQPQGGGEWVIHNHIHLNGREIQNFITRSTRSKEIAIYKGALVSS